MKKKLKKYDLGEFVTKNGGALTSGANFLAGGLDMLQNPNNPDAGLSAASGALSMAGQGLAIGGPWGAAAGAVIGGVSGLISAGAQRRKLEQKRVRVANNNLATNLNNQTQTNVDPYGTQMYEFGDFIEGDNPPKKKAAIVNKKAPTYNPSLLTNGKFLVSKPDGSISQWGNDLYETPSIGLPPVGQVPILPSNKAAGLDNTYYPSNMQRQGKDVPTQYPSRFEDGSFIGNPNNKQDESRIINSQGNIINIQKGELLIDPNEGTILQEFQGINPLTGGLYESHSKGRKKESPNNYTLADEGLFVITRKTAKQYKEAIDNNDKISQKTVLMNIRNAKIDKEGGLKPKNYAYGDYITDDTVDPKGWAQQQALLANRGEDLVMPRNPALAPQLGSFSNTITPVGTPQTSFATNTSQASNTLGSVVNGLSKYGPSLLNIGQGLFGTVDEQAHVTPAVNNYKNQIIANMPKDVDLSSVINDINLSTATADSAIQNNTNNAGVYRANRQQLASNSQRQLAGTRLQAEQINNQIRGQRSNIYNSLSPQDQQAQQEATRLNLGIDEINTRKKAAKQNLLNAGLSQLQQVQMNDKANSQKAALDKYSIGLLSQIFPNLKYYDQFDAEKINKQLGR